MNRYEGDGVDRLEEMRRVKRCLGENMKVYVGGEECGKMVGGRVV